MLLVFETVGISDAEQIWFKYGENPLLSAGTPGEWDSYHVRNPFVIKDGDTYKIWYAGLKISEVDYQIGYATYIPEPTTMLLLGSGLIGLMALYLSSFKGRLRI